MTSIPAPEADERALVRYRLPVTSVRISGSRTHVVNAASVPPVNAVRRNATAVARIEADPRLWFSFDNPGPFDRSFRSKVERKLDFTTMSDGRLVSLNATATDTSGERLKAAIQLGAGVGGVVGTLLSPAGPFGAAVGVAAGVVTGVAAYGLQGTVIDWETIDLVEPLQDTARPSLETLGIPPLYKAERPDAAELLGNLVWSEVQLLDAISRATTATALRAAGDLATRLRELQRALAAVRDALVEAERQCLSWVADQAQSDETSFDETLFADQLPTTRELHAAIAAVLPANDPRPWVGLYEDLRFAVTLDLLDPDIDANRTVRASTTGRSDEMIWYRRPRLATFTHWHIVKSGNRLRAEATLVERKVVVLPGDEEPLRVVSRTGSGTASAAFDGDGLLVGHSADEKDASLEKLKAVAQAPSLIKDGLVAGSAVVDGLTTTDAERASRAKDALELLKAEKELSAAQGSPAPDRLKQIREELEEAELQARLARARLVISDPTHSVVEFCSVSTSSAAG